MAFSLIIGGLLLLGVAAYFLLFKSETSEDSFIQPKVNIELIPYEAQGFNVRSRVSSYEWEQICRVVHKKKNVSKPYRCEQCGKNGLYQGFQHPVECHEVWHFDKDSRTQTLIGMVSICPLCHKSKHIGLADKMGFGDRVREHMARENNMSTEEVEKYVAQALKLVKKQSGRTFKLDLTYLNQPSFSFLKHRFTSDESHNCDSSIRY